MAIYDRTCKHSAIPPSTPALGDKWIVQVGSSYNAYTWLGDWILFAGGGVVKTETNPDQHSVRVIVQEEEPTLSDFKLKQADTWIKESTMQEYFYLYEWKLLAGA